MEKKARTAEVQISTRNTTAQLRKKKLKESPTLGAFVVAKLIAEHAESLLFGERAEAYYFIAEHLAPAEAEQFKMAGDLAINAGHAQNQAADITARAKQCATIAREMLAWAC